MSTEFRNKDFKNKELSKWPVTGAVTTANQLTLTGLIGSISRN